MKLRRAFGGPELAKAFDPFLLLDDFGSKFPHEYIAGFPWHPHRGIETVTYLIKGEVHHEDSTGTKGVIRTGEIQWMTAGSGIFHSEMPRPQAKEVDGRTVEDPEMKGLQLWVNLPAKSKMIDPRYRNLQPSDVPRIALDDGTVVKLVSGEIANVPGTGTVTGPVSELSVDVHYLDVTIPEGGAFEYRLPAPFNAFAYVLEGEAWPDPAAKEPVGAKSVVLFEREGESVRLKTKDSSARLLLVAGVPMNEPIAWYGPIVMNNRDELAKAVVELREGNFIRKKATSYDYFRA